MLSYLGKVIFSNTSLAVGTISITRYTNPSPNVNFHSMISYSSLSSLKKLYNMILSCYGASFCKAKIFPSCEFQLTWRFFLSTIITLTEGLVYIKNEWIYLYLSSSVVVSGIEKVSALPLLLSSTNAWPTVQRRGSVNYELIK